MTKVLFIVGFVYLTWWLRCESFFHSPTIIRYSKIKPRLLLSKNNIDKQQELHRASITWRTIPDMWIDVANIIPDECMIIDPVHDDKETKVSFSKAVKDFTDGAAALQKLGLKVGECVSIFSENSYRWLVLDQSIIKAGGSNAVRGASAPIEELKYIFRNSRSVGLVVESANQLQELLAQDPYFAADARFIVILFARGQSGQQLKNMFKYSGSAALLTYEELLASADANDFRSVAIEPSSAATLVYTSGTTSQPKGVVLCHSNLLHQVVSNSFGTNEEGRSLDPRIGDIFLSILPCWHIFERSAELFLFSRGTQVVYSNIRNFKSDLPKWKPDILITVPRLLETVQKGVLSMFKEKPNLTRRMITLLSFASETYRRSVRVACNQVLGLRPASPITRLVHALKAAILWPLYRLADALLWAKVRGGLGGRIRVAVCGGAALSMQIENFYDMVGITVLEGYGLTETSPVVSSRSGQKNVLGSVGTVIKDAQIKIVDVESKVELPSGDSGLLLVKSPGVMKEYMDNAVATREAIENDGFFNTGDLAKIDKATGSLVITGRAKDIIVLSNGENVAPGPIEEELIGASELIDQVMLVGQDERFVSAIIVVSISGLRRAGLLADADALTAQRELGPSAFTMGPSGDVEVLKRMGMRLDADEVVCKAIRKDVDAVCASKRPWERIAQIKLVVEPFNIANGQLTQTLKVRRHEIVKAYGEDIAKMYPKKGKK